MRHNVKPIVSRVFIMYLCLYHPENGRDTDNVIKDIDHFSLVNWNNVWPRHCGIFLRNGRCFESQDTVRQNHRNMNHDCLAYV